MRSERLFIFRGFTNDPESGLARILRRLAGPMGFAEMLCERLNHGGFHIEIEWITADGATLQAVVIGQIRSRG
jgi:hypothetical protein